METFRIVINILEDDTKWKYQSKTNITWWNQMVCMDVFLNSLGDPQPICKYDIWKKIHLIYYIILYVDVISTLLP